MRSDPAGWGVARDSPSVRSHRRHKEAPAGGQHPQKGVHHRPSEDGAHGTARRATVRSRTWRVRGARGTAHRGPPSELQWGDITTEHRPFNTVLGWHPTLSLSLSFSVELSLSGLRPRQGSTAIPSCRADYLSSMSWSLEPPKECGMERGAEPPKERECGIDESEGRAPVAEAWPGESKHGSRPVRNPFSK